jgi:hypothetical protein
VATRIVPEMTFFQLVDFVLQLIRHLDNALAVFVKKFALARQPEFLFAPLDQQRLELSFQ